MIIDNKFGPIDYFYLDLEDNSTKLVFNVQIDNYPDEGEEYIEIKFKIELFEDEDFFEKIVIKEELIYRTIY